MKLKDLEVKEGQRLQISYILKGDNSTQSVNEEFDNVEVFKFELSQLQDCSNVTVIMAAVVEEVEL